MHLPDKATLLINKQKSDLEKADWQPEKEIYVRVKALQVSHLAALSNIDFGSVINTEYYIFYTRFIENIDINMWLFFKGKTFEIKRIINKNFANRFLEIIALKI